MVQQSLVLDKNTSEVLNVNADTNATELAINLSASKLIFISDVPFIKDTQGERISAVDENVARKLFDENQKNPCQNHGNPNQNQQNQKIPETINFHEAWSGKY